MTNFITADILKEGISGDSVGLLLKGIQKDDIERGMVIAKPSSITAQAKFEAEVYVLTKEEGGRHTPFFTNYRPQFFIRTTDVTGTIVGVTACDGSAAEMVMPGDHIRMTVELIKPVAIEQGIRFAIREGGRTIGAGIISNILNGKLSSSCKSVYSGEANKPYFNDNIVSSQNIKKDKNTIVEYAELPSERALDIVFEIGGEIKKFTFNSKIQTPTSYFKDSLFEIAKQIKEKWKIWLETEKKQDVTTPNIQSENEEYDKEIKEDLGYNFIKIISNLAGCTFSLASRVQDNNSIDGFIDHANGRDRIRVQVKSRTNKNPNNSELRYDSNNNLNFSVSDKNHKDLRGETNTILIVVIIPNNKVNSTSDFQLKAYWSATSTWEEGKKTVPLETFDVSPLNNMMNTISDGEYI